MAAQVLRFEIRLNGSRGARFAHHTVDGGSPDSQ
jgi:hypothetical protein